MAIQDTNTQEQTITPTLNNPMTYSAEELDMIKNALNFSSEGNVPNAPIQSTQPSEDRVTITSESNSETDEIAKKYANADPNIVQRKKQDYRVINVQLPSQGKYYSINSTCHNIKSVRVRELTATDEDILLSRKLMQSGKVFDVLIKNVLIDKNINPEDLLASDRFAILLALRINDLGSDYDAKDKVECPVCEEKFSPIYNLEKLEPKKLNEDNKISINDNGTITLKIPSGNELEIKFLSGKEETMIEEEVAASRRLTKNEGIDKIFTIRLKHYIVSIDGNKDKTFIKDFVENGSLKLKDSRAIRKFLNDNMPEISMVQKISCTDCYEEFDQEIPITKEFFYPSL